MLIAAHRRLPVLLVITFRPEFAPPWAGQPTSRALTLNRLGRRRARRWSTGSTGGKALPRELLDQIVDKTDGVPLFVEELTKAVLESDLLEDARRPLRAARPRSRRWRSPPPCTTR